MVGSGHARLEPVGFTVPPITSSTNVAAAASLANRCSSMDYAVGTTSRATRTSPRRRCDTTPPRMWTRGNSAGYDSVAGMSVVWDETTSIGTLRSDDLGQPDIIFRYNHYLYRTVGQHLANGG